MSQIHGWSRRGQFCTQAAVCQSPGIKDRAVQENRTGQWRHRGEAMGAVVVVGRMWLVKGRCPWILRGDIDAWDTLKLEAVWVEGRGPPQ